MGKAKRRQHRTPVQTPAPRRPDSGFPRTGFPWTISAVLFLTTLLIYAPVSRFDFVNFDDPDYVTRNAHVLRGLTTDGVSWAFTSGEAANWFPLTRLSHLLDVQLFGLDAGFHHLVSVFIHALATMFLFAFLYRATAARWPSAFVALLFALHPLHVESVAWISERKDVLCAFFWFLSLWGYVRYTEKKSTGRFLFALLAFVLGLLSKPMIVTLPFVLLLLDIWPLRRALDRSVLLEKMPFFALTSIAAAVTYRVQQGSGAVQTAEIFPFALRIENAVLSYVTYVGEMVWPAGLAVYYPYPSSIAAWKFGAAGALLVGVSIAVVRYFRECPYLAVGWFWYLGTLVPVIGLVQVGAQAHADRYTYVPSIGLCIMVAWGAADLLKRRPSAKVALAGAAAVVCLSSAVLCEAQIQYWKSSEMLFRHAVDVTDRNFLAHYDLGIAVSTIPGRLPEAISEYQAALRIEPNSDRVHTDLGNALAQTGRLAEAIAEYREAVRISPNSPIPHVDLANALASDPAHLAETIAEYETALRLKPDYVQGHINLGALLASTGQMDEAIPHFQAALKIDPNSAEAHANLGMALAGLPGRTAEAIAQLQEALRIQPDPRIQQMLDRLRAAIADH